MRCITWRLVNRAHPISYIRVHDNNNKNNFTHTVHNKAIPQSPPTGVWYHMTEPPPPSVNATCPTYLHQPLSWQRQSSSSCTSDSRTHSLACYANVSEAAGQPVLSAKHTHTEIPQATTLQRQSQYVCECGGTQPGKLNHVSTANRLQTRQIHFTKPVTRTK